MLKFYSLNEPTGSDEQQVLDATCHIFRGLYMLQYAIIAFRAENAGKSYKT
jgi:hypothetical protein